MNGEITKNLVHIPIFFDIIIFVQGSNSLYNSQFIRMMSAIANAIIKKAGIGRRFESAINEIGSIITHTRRTMSFRFRSRSCRCFRSIFNRSKRLFRSIPRLHLIHESVRFVERGSSLRQNIRMVLTIGKTRRFHRTAHFTERRPTHRFTGSTRPAGTTLFAGPAGAAHWPAGSLAVSSSGKSQFGTI